MRRLVLGMALSGTLAFGGCATSTRQLVIDCTVDAGSSLISDVMTALGKENYEQAIASLIYPVGKFFAEDISCIVNSFLNNPKLSADPANAVIRDHAREYLAKRHYKVSAK